MIIIIENIEKKINFLEENSHSTTNIINCDLDTQRRRHRMLDDNSSNMYKIFIQQKYSNHETLK